MSKQLDTAQAVAIVNATRMPGFNVALKMLDDLAQEIKDEAFNSDDDSKAVRLVHEGRGAARLLRNFKAALATTEQSVRQLPLNPDSPDWR